MLLQVGLLLCCISLSAAFLPEQLSQDIESLLEHWDLHFSTFAEPEDETSEEFEAMNNAITSYKRLQFIMTSVINGNKLDEIDFAEGALFLPLSTSPPLYNFNKLVRRSGLKNPLFLYSVHTTAIPAWLSTVHIPYNTSVYVILQHEDNTRWLTLQEAYHLSENTTELTVNLVATRKWEEDGDRWYFDGTSDVVRRANLMGTTMFDAVDTSGLKEYLWKCETTIRETIEKLNISIQQVILSDPNLIGEPDSDGDWSGAYGMFQRHEADISLCPLHPSPDVELIADATISFESGSYRLFLRKPEFTFSLESVLKGFSLAMWLVSGFSLAVLAASLYVISHVTCQTGIEEGQAFHFSESLLVILGDFCVKGWSRLPRSKSGQVVCMCSLLLGYLLNMYYVLQLQANLTSRTGQMPFTDIQGLVKVESYNLLMYGTSAPHAAAMTARSGVWKEVNDVMKRHGNAIYFSFTDGASRTCHEPNVALLGWKTLMNPFMKSQGCTLVAAKTRYFSDTLMFPLRRGFPYNKVLSYYLLRDIEGGLRNRLSRLPVLEEEIAAFQDTDLLDVLPFLLLYATAIATAVTFLLLEILHSRKAQFKLQSMNNLHFIN